MISIDKSSEPDANAALLKLKQNEQVSYTCNTSFSFFGLFGKVSDSVKSQLLREYENLMQISFLECEIFRQLLEFDTLKLKSQALPKASFVGGHSARHFCFFKIEVLTSGSCKFVYLMSFIIIPPVLCPSFVNLEVELGQVIESSHTHTRSNILTLTSAPTPTQLLPLNMNVHNLIYRKLRGRRGNNLKDYLTKSLVKLRKAKLMIEEQIRQCRRITRIVQARNQVEVTPRKKSLKKLLLEWVCFPTSGLPVEDY